jgi:sulfoacetaldehyde dehydrogenase
LETPGEDVADVAELLGRARAAQARYERDGSQERYDRAAAAIAWAIMEPGRNRALAELSVATTGLGNVADKVAKNHRKTLGLMRDIAGVRSFGLLSDDPATGIATVARPHGVVAAVVPSTNPAATPANNAINALKCGNAVVFAPSPSGAATCARLVEFIHAEFSKTGEDPDLVRMLPPPAGKARTRALVEGADLAIVTGSQDNVRRAVATGTPTIGVGTGNVATIVDETADLAAAARRIARSKCFDNATSCSSENALVVVDAVYDAFAREARAAGAAILPESAAAPVIARLWPGGRLNRDIIARDAEVMIDRLGLSGDVPAGAEFLLIETRGIGPGHPLSHEKLSRVAALYRAADFEDAAEIARRLLETEGAGHSVGIHSSDAARPLDMARRLPVARVIVNQPHCFATGGNFDNGLPFSLSMGCGSWGGNAIDENLHWRHFLQHSRVVRPIPPREPSLDDVFAEYWRVAGR